MSYGFVVLQSSDIPDNWKCAICLESEQKDLVIAHVRYIRGMDKRQVKVCSNGGEKHPIHQSCFLQTMANRNPKCPSCREELYDKEAFYFSERLVTRADGTQAFVREIDVPVFPCFCPVKDLPPFKE